jgi:required for meiotic nuclear division protein 1
MTSLTDPLTRTPAGNLPIARDDFKIRAVLLGERLDLRGWENLDVLATTPLAVRVHRSGIAILLRYGVVVFFDVPPQDEIAFLDVLRARTLNPYASPETELLEARVMPGAKETLSGNVVTLDAATIERLQLVADVLGKSVVLALYESRIASTFDAIEPLAEQLEQTGTLVAKAPELLRHIGSTLLVDHRMVGRVAVAEKPEILWDHPELEGLFIRLEDEFEIRERHEALERKLAVISRTAETLLELIQSRHALRVEWYIVALIIVEVLLTLYELFLKPLPLHG